MAYRKLPEGVLEFVRNNAQGRKNAELAEITNRTFGTSFTAAGMKGYKSANGIKSGIKPKPPSAFTPEIREYIVSHCEGVRYRDMAEMVNNHFGTNIPVEKFRWFYQNNKIKCGVRTSWNKAAPGTVSQKKGDYQYIKMEDGTWKLYHHVLWERENGPIPPDCAITFIDGDIQNVDISNLELVSRQELFQLAKDGLRFECPEMNKTGILIAKLRVAARKKEKELKGHE